MSAGAGMVRIRRGEDGTVTIRGVVRAHASIFSWRRLADQVQQLASNPPAQQSGNLIQIGDLADRWLAGARRRRESERGAAVAGDSRVPFR